MRRYKFCLLSAVEGMFSVPAVAMRFVQRSKTIVRVISPRIATLKRLDGACKGAREAMDYC